MVGSVKYIRVSIKLPIPLKLKKIAEITDAVLVGEDLVIECISTDTRKDVNGSLFIPLKGERFDGHEFIKAAAEGGAVASFVSKDFWMRGLGRCDGIAMLIVEDTSEAFLKLASYLRKELGFFVIGVGGSVGKTTTKELIHFVLTQLGVRAHKSAKSYNNNVGLAISLSSAERNTEVGVIEIGTSRKGEIRYLAGFADPDLGVLTAIGKEHLEGLEDERGVFEEEMELIRYVARKNGIVSVNVGHEEVLNYFLTLEGRKIGFCAAQKRPEIRASLKSPLVTCAIIEVDDLFGSTFEILIEGGGFSKGLRARTKLAPHLGEVLAASVSGVLGYLSCKLGFPEAVETISNSRIDLTLFENESGRFNVRRVGGVVIVDDSYNSNPASVEGMFFSASFKRGRKIFILGDMLELGRSSEKEHENIGMIASRYLEPGETLFVVSGEFSRFTHEGLLENHFTSHNVSSRNEVAKIVANIVKEGDTIFIKASRRCRFEEIADELYEVLRKRFF